MAHKADTITALIQTEADGTEGPVGLLIPPFTAPLPAMSTNPSDEVLKAWGLIAEGIARQQGLHVRLVQYTRTIVMREWKP